MNKPHKHAEVIKAAADGKDVQSRISDAAKWDTHSGKYALKFCAWEEFHQYRIKPEQQYPVTRMTHEEIYCVWMKQRETLAGGDLEAVANAAIRRAIEDGDVVLPKEKA